MFPLAWKCRLPCDHMGDEGSASEEVLGELNEVWSVC